MDPSRKKNMESKLIDIQQGIENYQEQDIIQVSTFALFMKIGIIVLSIIMIVGFGIKIIPETIPVINMSNKSDLPVFRVNTEVKKVALSFNVTWNNEGTKSILDILDKNDVKATFFMTGEWVKKYPDEVKAIAAADHDLGNHSENHEPMSQLSKDQCMDEIMKAHIRVEELTGIEMTLFRAPYGDYNDTVIQAARECGYDTVQWDVDSLDWKDYGVDGIINKTVNNKKLGNGSIILLHNGAKYTPEALELIIVGLQDNGYELVPVSELIYTGDYKVDQTGRQIAK